MFFGLRMFMLNGSAAAAALQLRMLTRSSADISFYQLQVGKHVRCPISQIVTRC